MIAGGFIFLTLGFLLLGAGGLGLIFLGLGGALIGIGGGMIVTNELVGDQTVQLTVRSTASDESSVTNLLPEYEVSPSLDRKAMPAKLPDPVNSDAHLPAGIAMQHPKQILDPDRTSHKAGQPTQPVIIRDQSEIGLKDKRNSWHSHTLFGASSALSRRPRRVHGLDRDGSPIDGDYRRRSTAG